MKHLNKIFLMALAGATFTSCVDLDEAIPEGSTVTETQLEQVLDAVPDRTKADLSGMYYYLGSSGAVSNSSSYHNDGGFGCVALSMDCNGPDIVGDNTGFNWFKPAFQWSDRSPNFIIAICRYSLFYNSIKQANDLIAGIDPETESTSLKAVLGQALAMRAFNYLSLAPYFQFNYKDNADKPCIPIVTPTTPNTANNPRATMKEVFALITEDLTKAIECLDGFERTSKTAINQNVAYGLRARAYLAMGEYAKAAEDAEKAMAGFTPASIADVSKPAFCKLSEGNWMWGLLAEKDKIYQYANAAGHLNSFSGDNYSAGAGCYKGINKLLYDKIPATDVRKGWWVNENLESPLLENLTWGDYKGQAIAAANIEDTKVPFVPYTNVKFGMKSGIGSTVNDCDFPLMRVEEMMLIKAEGLAMSGNVGGGLQALQDFVKNYRDPAYAFSSTSAAALQNEIWKQRRIELWAEGFSMFDVMRLQKPVVRFHDGEASNFPSAFAFNVPANDPYMLLRFPQLETNTNSGVTVNDNNEGSIPVAGQYGSLRDGVTD